MNYRHAFHAGNFADVVKHIVLVALLDSMQRKDKGFLCLDCFAGLGIYDLHSSQAARSPEYVDGIIKLWDYASNHKIDDLTSRYLEVLTSISDSNQRYYPGSPFIIAKLLREQDRAVFNELHPEDFESLKENIHEFSPKCDTRHFAFENIDAYQTIKSKLPPQERRGLIFIDPPFEKPNEYDLIVSGIDEGIKRFATGVYGIWLAVKDKKQNRTFLNNIKKIGKEALYIEFTLRNPNNPDSTKKNGLVTMGMCIVNPPFGLSDSVKSALQTIKKALHQDEYTNFEVKTL